MVEKLEYKVAHFERLSLASTTLQGGDYDALVRERFSACIDTEAPITRSLLLKRVVNSFGLFKVGWRLDNYFKAILEDFSGQLEDECGVAVYHSPCENRHSFRPNTKDIRFSHQIPPSEAANVIVAILEASSRRMRRKDIYNFFLGQLGYSKTGNDLAELFTRALTYALDQGMVCKSKAGTFHL